MDGNDNSNMKMIALLGRIADRLDSFAANTNRQLEALQQGQAITNQRLESLEHGQAATNQRLDDMLKFIGNYHADHEQRLRALEERVFVKSG
jgi:parvulin-like peptidyl-prolyl isomerase